MIFRGEMEASRTLVVGVPDVAAIRRRAGASQGEFARMLGISVGTLQGWEQGRRTPQGPARVLLHVADRYPDVVRGTAQALGVAKGASAPRNPAPARAAKGKTVPTKKVANQKPPLSKAGTRRTSRVHA